MGIGPFCKIQVQSNTNTQFIPMKHSFTPLNRQIEISGEHDKLFRKIKKALDILDCRGNKDLEWFQSPKYNLFLYGTVVRDRPFGECFFYINDKSNKSTPIIISTTVNEHYVYSPKTLIIYHDNYVYYGSIKNNIAILPRAEGKGILFSPQLIYEGQFKNGFPHGYGKYRSKVLQYTGQFKNGQTFGQCIQKSSDQLFIGQISDTNTKKGMVINKNNEKSQVGQKQEITQENRRFSLKSYFLE